MENKELRKHKYLLDFASRLTVIYGSYLQENRFDSEAA